MTRCNSPALFKIRTFRIDCTRPIYILRPFLTTEVSEMRDHQL